MNVRPDGILGAIVGSESLGTAETLINGAGGCRSRAQIVLRGLIPEYGEGDTGCCDSLYFGKQSRLPCSYINGDDIVFGPGPKVADGVSSIRRITGRDVLLVDTLGASLVCDDRSGMDPAPITMEGDLSSMTFDEGYDLACEAIVRSVVGSGDKDPLSVNVLGYGICDLGWTYGMAELRELLAMMCVRVNAFIGCRPGADGIRASGSSALNIELNPARCRRTADLYGELFGMPSLRPSAGAPVGYRATRSLLREVGDALGVDPTPALDAVDRDECDVRRMLRNNERMPDGLKARRYSVTGESCNVLPLVEWMTEVFCMIPGSVRPTDGAYEEEIRSALDRRGFGCAMGAEDHPDTEVLFTDGLTALDGSMGRGIPAYVEVTMPRGREMNLTGRCLVGRPGCRYILDEMLNGITRFRCGQPAYIDRP